MEGEIEHAQTMAHTLRFGNQFREAIGTKSYIAFSNTSGPASCALTIPLMDKHDGGQSSYYQTIQTSISDAPAADEIIIALAGSIGGHPNHWVGNRYKDLRDLGYEINSPAGV